MRMTFSTPVTPTRESPTGIDGVRAWTSSPTVLGESDGVERIVIGTSPASLAPHHSRVAQPAPNGLRICYQSTHSSDLKRGPIDLGPGKRAKRRDCQCQTESHRRPVVRSGEVEAGVASTGRCLDPGGSRVEHEH